jgi:hypothetical protein
MLPMEWLNGESGVIGHVVDTSVCEAYPVVSGTFCLSKCQLLVGTHDEQIGQTSSRPQYAPDVTSRMATAFATFSWTITRYHSCFSGLKTDFKKMLHRVLGRGKAHANHPSGR